MNFPAGLRHPATRIIALGLLAFALLTVRFSPNWAAFYYGLRDARVNVTSVAQDAAIDKAIFSAYSARGYYVLQQARDLNAEIDDANHKIVRWRLLVPALGLILKLPGWVILGLAQIGCWVFVTVLVAMAYHQARAAGRPTGDAIWLGVIAGASAPFFTSMGLLGYYDSWLALALLAVAFVRPRPVVWLACVLAPWVDERFVIGLPLALCVRRMGDSNTVASRWSWLKQQALPPTCLVLGYTLLRLNLGGSGGSQTMGQYLNQFVFSGQISVGQRLLGVWEGLHAGWFLVLVALVGTKCAGAAPRRIESGLLAVGVVLTGLVGLFTALDMSRSMVLLIPVVPLGWMIAARTTWWRHYHVAPVLAATAWLVPAWHVVGATSRQVDNLWSPASPLVIAHNNLGLWLVETPGREADARLHFTEALRLKPDYAEAHNNLALIMAKIPGGEAEALAHYAAALRLKPDFADAHNNLALLLAKMPGRHAEAEAHYTAALRLKADFAEVHNNLATLLDRWPGREAEALGHYAEALRLKPHSPEIRYNLALVVSALPGRQQEAIAHYAEAIRAKPDYAEAHNNLAVLLAGTPARQADALSHYLEALRIRPDFAQAHYNLANLLVSLPARQAEALAHYREAARLLPDNPTVHLTLARQLELWPETKAEAEVHYVRALSLDPKLSAARAGLERLRN
jgi:tetratricopeptide (TPR) repeat protein